MGTTLFYFTGTGNSLMVARDLADELGGAKLISIARAIQKPEIDLMDECIGFVFPVYFADLPLMVREFIGKLQFNSTQYVFAIVNCGAIAGNALYRVSELLGKQGIELAAGFQLALPDNYIVKFNAPAASTQEKQFKREKLKVKEIAAAIKAKQRLGIEGVPFNFIIRCLIPVYNRVFGIETDSKRAAKIHHDAGNFRVDDRCNSCNRCQSVCPVGNIKMESGKPKWQGHCEQCLACIHWCPQQAIEYGNKTSHRKRYKNPTVTVKDIIDSAGNE
ncbi:MAG TPA: EFR1 family ferrodoxin [Bacillota bacterium]|nr:EFR1 family ferrodoxin [Bacillota bacterium]